MRVKKELKSSSMLWWVVSSTWFSWLNTCRIQHSTGCSELPCFLQLCLFMLLLLQNLCRLGDFFVQGGRMEWLGQPFIEMFVTWTASYWNLGLDLCFSSFLWEGWSLFTREFMTSDCCMKDSRAIVTLQSDLFLRPVYYDPVTPVSSPMICFWNVECPYSEVMLFFESLEVFV